MPLYNFRCNWGHLFEAFSPDTERETMRCRYCKKQAYRVWVSRSTFEREAQPFIPPVVHRNPVTGHVMFPGRSDAQPHAGYERVELRTVSQIRRFEHEQNEEGRRQHNDMLVREQMRHDFMKQRIRPDLERTARSGPPNLRAYAERALARLDSKDYSRAATKFDPRFCVEAFSYDSSNRSKCDDLRPMLDRQRR